MNYFTIYNKLLNDKILRLKEMANIKNMNNECVKCKKKFDKVYKVENIKISDANIHELFIHDIILYELYENIIN